MTSPYQALANHPQFAFRNLFINETSLSQAELLKRADIAIIEPGGGGPVPAHQHDTAHLFVVIQGMVAVIMDKKVHQVDQFQSIYIPSGVEHTMHNPTNSDATVLGLTL